MEEALDNLLPPGVRCPVFCWLDVSCSGGLLERVEDSRESEHHTHRLVFIKKKEYIKNQNRLQN